MHINIWDYVSLYCWQWILIFSFVLYFEHCMLFFKLVFLQLFMKLSIFSCLFHFLFPLLWICLLIPLFCFLSVWIFLVDFRSCFYILDIKPCYIYCIYFSQSHFLTLLILLIHLFGCAGSYLQHTGSSLAVSWEFLVVACKILVLWPGPLPWKPGVLSYSTTRALTLLIFWFISYVCISSI